MLFGISITLVGGALIGFLLVSFLIMLYYRGHRHAYRVTRYRVLLIIFFGKNIKSYFVKFLKVVMDDYRTARRMHRQSRKPIKKPPS